MRACFNPERCAKAGGEQGAEPDHKGPWEACLGVSSDPPTMKVPRELAPVPFLSFTFQAGLHSSRAAFLRSPGILIPGIVVRSQAFTAMAQVQSL